MLLEGWQKEYNQIQKTLKRELKEVKNTVIGNWLIDGTMIEKDGYFVKATEYWKMNIKKF